MKIYATSIFKRLVAYRKFHAMTHASIFQASMIKRMLSLALGTDNHNAYLFSLFKMCNEIITGHAGFSSNKFRRFEFLSIECMKEE
jgi:hypothetical protein